MEKRSVLIACLTVLLCQGSVAVPGRPPLDGTRPETAAWELAQQPPGLRLEVADGPWPSFRQDVRHTGQSVRQGPAAPSLKWQYDLGNLAYASPSVGPDGTIYTGSADSIFAISASGARRWAFPVGDYVVSSPALDANGVVYAGSRDKRLYALRASNGSLVWSFPTGGEIWSSPTVGPDGTIYIGSFDENLYAVHPATGRSVWSFKTGGEIVSSPAIAPDGTIYVGSTDSTVYATNPNGSAKWRFRTGGEVVSSPAIGSDGTVYVGSRDGRLYAIRPDGAQRWAFPTGGEIISSPAVATDGTVYVGSRDGRLYAIRPDGTQKWNPFVTEGEVMSSPAIDAEGTVYVGSLDGRLYAVNGNTGTQRWRYEAGSGIWSSPSIGEERTLFFSESGTAEASGKLHAVGSVPFEVGFPTSPTAGSPLTVQLRPVGGTLSGSGRLFFRRGGERQFQPPVPMQSAGGGGFQATIPAEFSTVRGIEYYIEFTDGARTTTFPLFEPQQRPAFEAVRVARLPAEATLRPGRYAMVTIPLLLAEPDPAAVLDDYGPYNINEWRLFRWEGDGYREFPNIQADFLPGTAFFLITRSGQPFEVENGISLSSRTPFQITLQPGLNQIGSPFAFPVRWSEVTPAGGDVQLLSFFDPETNEMIQDPSRLQVLNPWTGYFVRNRSSSPVTLTIPPRQAAEAAFAKQGQALADTHPGGAVIRLQARVPGTRLQDTQNWIGFLPEALEGEDRKDFVEAPPIGDYVQVSIVENGVRYAGSFKPLTGQGGHWDFEVRTSLPLKRRDVQTVEVSIQEEAPLPEGFRIYLADRDNSTVVPVAPHGFTVALSGEAPVRQFRLLIGTEAFVQDPELSGIVTPVGPVLEASYPNPFHAETRIRYRLDREVPVVLAVYNAMGQRVRVLVDEVQGQGPHEVSWDGRNDGGERVADGVYFYRIHAGAFRATGKMLLLR